MDMFVKALCFSLLIAYVHAGGGPIIENGVDDSSIQVDEGENNYEIIWWQDTEGNPTYTKIKVEHIPTSTKEKRLIGKLTNLVSEDLMTGYNLTVAPRETYGNNIILTIESVRTEDDGTFIVTATSNQQMEDRVVQKNLTVIRPIQHVHLQFADHDPISTKPEDPIEVDAGTYQVKCIAEGSNPATEDVQLHLDGNNVPLDGEHKHDLMSGDETQYRTTVMGNVTFPLKEATLELQCSATDSTGKAITTKLDVSVMVPEVKDVDCKKTTAKEGDTSVSLECTIDRSLVNATGYAFEIGKTGDMIEPGQDNSNGTAAATMTVTELSATKTKVTMTLPKAEDWHFDTDFYLIIKLPNNEVRKETIKLNNSDGDSGNRPAASLLGWTLLSLVVATWLRC